jgi:hypothetical protein
MIHDTSCIGKNLNRFKKNMHYFCFFCFFVIVLKIPLSLALSHKGRGNVPPPILPLDKGRSEEGLSSLPLMGGD